MAKAEDGKEGKFFAQCSFRLLNSQAQKGGDWHRCLSFFGSCCIGSKRREAAELKLSMNDTQGIGNMAIDITLFYEAVVGNRLSTIPVALISARL